MFSIDVLPLSTQWHFHGYKISFRRNPEDSSNFFRRNPNQRRVKKGIYLRTGTDWSRAAPDPNPSQPEGPPALLSPLSSITIALLLHATPPFLPPTDSLEPYYVQTCLRHVHLPLLPTYTQQ